MSARRPMTAKAGLMTKIHPTIATKIANDGADL
jgi:hypothetical protein